CVKLWPHEARSPVPKLPGAFSYHATFRWFLLGGIPSSERGTFGPQEPCAQPPMLLAFQPDPAAVSAKSPASTSIPVSVSSMSWAALSRMPLPFQSTSSVPATLGDPDPSGALSMSLRYLPLPF